MKKHALWILLLTVVLLFTACADQQPAAGEQSPEETAKAFLNTFYTADEEGRYTEFLSATEGASSDETLDAAADAYHASLAEFSTEEVVETLAQNRTLSQYDAAHAGQDVQVQSVELEADDGFYAFTVEIDAGGTAETYTGQISVAEDTGLVDNFYQAAA